VQLPENSGFANTSSKSPFATASSGVNIFGGVNTASMFANSKFGALSGSAASPFGTLGAKASQSPFGALGAAKTATTAFGGAKTATSGFGSGSAFGSSAGGSVFGGSFGSSAKSQAPKKPFGAPDDDGEKTEEDEDDGSEDDGDDDKKSPAEDDTAGKALGLKEQEGRGLLPLTVWP
jgi:Ran-binding protein 3